MSAHISVRIRRWRSTGCAKAAMKYLAAVEEKLHAYLLAMLRRDVMPDFYTKGMAATVRAVALAALVDHGKIDSIRSAALPVRMCRK